jgi:hypothetical protein
VSRLPVPKRLLDSIPAAELISLVKEAGAHGTIALAADCVILKRVDRMGLMISEHEFSVTRSRHVQPDVLARWLRKSGGRLLWQRQKRVESFRNADALEAVAVPEAPERAWSLRAVFPMGTVSVGVSPFRGTAVRVLRRRLAYRNFNIEGKPTARNRGVFTVSVEVFGEHGWVRSAAKSLSGLLAPYRLPDPPKRSGPKRRIFMLSQGRRGLGLKLAAQLEGALERDNYAPDVVQQFDQLVKDITSPTPDGRLAILRGPPGTGKTFMVRGLIEASKGIRFVLVPAQYIPEVMSPSFSALLMRQRIPTCLVIEDADMLLLDRKADNMSAVSVLLNMADGIFGMIADIRLVCTTNAPRLDIDPGLRRSGRLCANIEVGLLGPEQATRVLRRLTLRPDEPAVTQSMSLADLYAMAAGRAISSVPAQFGFSRRPD